MVGGGEGAGDGVAGAFGGLDGEERVDGFFEPSVKEVFVAVEGDHAAVREPLFEGEVEPVDGVEEEEGADAFVEVVALTAEGVEFGAFSEKFR